jgi:cytochrome c oxidase subunit 2
MRAGRVALGAMVMTVAATIFGACGSSSGGSSPATTAAGAPAIDVTAKSFSFAPDEIIVKTGESATIALTAKDIPHDFTVKELDIHVAAQAGKTASKKVTFDKPGTYTFYCSVAGHREAGMVGKLVVQ